MKRIFIILTLVLCTVTLGAQQKKQLSIVSGDGYQTDSYCGVVSGHSLSVSLIGVEYAYEFALSTKASLILRAGLPFVMTEYSREYDEYYGYDVEASFDPNPGVTIEPRYYTNMERRALNGKFTGNNCANFWSLRTIVYPVAGHVYMAAIPMYGLRRGSEHWFREWTFGLGYHSMYQGIAPHINFRLGYTF